MVACTTALLNWGSRIVNRLLWIKTCSAFGRSPAVCNVIGSTAHDRHGTFSGVVDSTLQNNGGTTPTLALPPGSAAINGGDPTGCKDENGNPLPTDQRGFARVGPCDIGAFEFVLRGFLPLIRR